MIILLILLIVCCTERLLEDHDSGGECDAIVAIA